VGLEGAFLDRQLAVGMGAEEGCEGQGLKVGTTESTFAVRQRELGERLNPGMADQGVPPGLESVRRRAARGQKIAHGGHCATLPAAVG